MNLNRKIKPRSAVIEQISTDDIVEVKDWLQAKGQQFHLKWLLAHADDGVIWGIVENDRLATSYEAAQGNSEAKRVCPPLHIETLQQARLFSKDAELLLWRDGYNRWHVRLIRQPVEGETPTFTEAIDEPQMLWGTDPKPLQRSFTLMRDGAQGLLHAVPLEVKGKITEQTRPLRLWVRHYVIEDETGFKYIACSCLFDLTMEEQKDEQ